MENYNLKKDTIFDICKDENYINENVLNIALGVTKDLYLETYKENPINRVFDLYNYAETFNLTNLINDLDKLYKSEIETFFNE